MGQSIIKNIKKIFSQSSSPSGGGGSTIWGAITGFLSNQTDLQNALDSKVDENTPITGATKTKITYDSKGLVTSGDDATTADIADSINKRYVSDAQLTILGNTSGTNTGDETKSSIITKLDLHSGSVNIDFGISGDVLITTVPALWITNSHYGKIKCEVFNDGIEHTGEEVYLENILANVYNIVPNVSFDIITVAHNSTSGKYVVRYNEII